MSFEDSGKQISINTVWVYIFGPLSGGILAGLFSLYNHSVVTQDQKKKASKKVKPEIEQEVVIREVEKIIHVDVGVGQVKKVVNVGEAAPQFDNAQAFWDGQFKAVSLMDFRGKYIVLLFYPSDFTSICPTEVTQFADINPAFERNNCQILACSTDSKYSHREWTMKIRKHGGIGKVPFPLISDLRKEISQKYGCLIEDSNNKYVGAALRATYIIDSSGILRHVTINDLQVGRSPVETLRLVQAFQHSDLFGEVCPASWKPGQMTMMEDINNFKNIKYFQDMSELQHMETNADFNSRQLFIQAQGTDRPLIDEPDDINFIKNQKQLMKEM